MRTIELFAGSGGAALGLERAGCEHLGLFEIDESACATLRAAGFPRVARLDVRDLDAVESFLRLSEEDAWRTAGDRLLDSDLDGEEWTLERERLASEMIERSTSPDLMWASFPCQAWSKAGARRAAEDERNGWPWTVDAIDRFKPRWFLAENVRGLTFHSVDGHPDPFRCPRCYLDAVIVPQLRARFAHAGWWIVNASDFGVPQHRRRVIVWAGPAPLRPPPRTHGDPGEARQRDLFGRSVRSWRTMGEALGLGTEGLLGKPAPSVTTTEAKGTRGANIVRDLGNGKRSGGIDRASDALFLATGRRRLTIAEAALLQDFPPDWPFSGTSESRYRQIGNAVPPTLAEVVGRAVIAADRAHRGASAETTSERKPLPSGATEERWAT